MKNNTNIFNLTDFHIYNPGSNIEVTKHYVSIITRALNEAGCNTTIIHELQFSEENKKRGIVVASLYDVKHVQKYKYGKIICWIQGVEPEEIYLSERKKARFVYRFLRESIRLQKVDFVFFCSEKMRKHYQRKCLGLIKHYYVMPCFNEEINKDIIINKDYPKNIFLYAGSLAKWQCFDRTVEIYKKIEDHLGNTEFHVYVKDKEKAQEVLDKYNVKNYKIDFVSPEQLAKKIQEVKFGFCVRDNITVNRVATPTKLSNYISNGIMPIYSSCLSSFHSIAQHSNYCFSVDEPDFLDNIIEIGNSDLTGIEIYNDFQGLFGKYYSSNYHVLKIVSLFKGE